MNYRTKREEVTGKGNILDYLGNLLSRFNKEYIVGPFYTLNRWEGTVKLYGYAHITDNSSATKRKKPKDNGNKVLCKKKKNL